MLRKILAVIAGMVAGSICVGVVEKIGHHFYPPPASMKEGDMGAFKEYVATAPFMALFFVILAYALAALVSGFIATKISNNGKHTSAIICGIIFLLTTVYYMVILPTPIWFWVLGIAVWVLTLAGSSLALNKKTA
jgi:hypothetical protein